jgi:hypothetical protein
MHPSHHPLVAGPGISLTVDDPFGANHKLNSFRSSYIRQNFSESPTTKMKTMEKGTCYRSTYATGSSVLTMGTPIRYNKLIHWFVTLVLYILKFSFVGQYDVRPFTDAMRTIAKVIGEFIEKHFKHDKIPPNNCVLITYLSGMSLPEHRDITYSKKWWGWCN